MADDQTKPSFRLEFTPEDRQAYRHFLHQLYYEEGNITFPLWLFDEEIRYNYNRVSEHYSSGSDILQHGEAQDLKIRLDAVEQALDSLEVDGAVIFGVTGIAFLNKTVVSDEFIRSSLTGEKPDQQRKEYYHILCSIQQLLLELFEAFEKYNLPCETGLGLLEYRHSAVMDLDECLHRIMAPKPRSPFMCEGFRGRSREGAKDTYQVFISHAGEDKQTMTIPLQKRLAALGVNSFLDIEELRPGDLAASSMQHAMLTAPLGVIILSPEFAAKRWPMRELDCFAERTRGKGSPAQVLPVFYRLQQEDCGDTDLFRMENEVGQNLFESLGVFDRVETGETSLKKVHETLKAVARISGIENDEGAGNGSSREMLMKRDRLLDRIADSVMYALEDN